MHPCSKHGHLVGKKCVCDPGFTGIDWISQWNDCQISKKLIGVMNGGLMFTASCLILRCIYILFELTTSIPGTKISDSYHSYRFTFIVRYFRRYFVFTALYGSIVLSRCILAFDIKPDRTSNVRMVLDGVMCGFWLSSLAITPMLWSMWASNEDLLNFCNGYLIILTVGMVWVTIISISVAYLFSVIDYWILYYVTYIVNILFIICIGTFCARMKSRIKRCLYGLLRDSSGTDEVVDLISLKAILTKIKWSSYFLNTLIILGIVALSLMGIHPYFERRIWIITLAVMETQCIYSGWATIFFKPKFLEERGYTVETSSITAMVFYASTTERHQMPEIISSGRKNMSNTFISESNLWWQRK